MSISPVMKRLSGYIAQAGKKALPPAVAERTKHHVLDTIAAMVSGSQLLPGRKAIGFIKTIGGTKEACVIGSRIVTTAINAALANGMCAHADETDDSHAPSVMHPGCGIVPAALAAGQQARAGDHRRKRVEHVMLGAFKNILRKRLARGGGDIGAQPLHDRGDAHGINPPPFR